MLLPLFEFTFSASKRETLCASEVFVSAYQTTRRHNAEERNVNQLAACSAATWSTPEWKDIKLCLQFGFLPDFAASICVSAQSR
jgi:hypothetical protein